MSDENLQNCKQFTCLSLSIVLYDNSNSLFQGFRGEEVVGKLQDEFLPYLSIGG